MLRKCQKFILPILMGGTAFYCFRERFSNKYFQVAELKRIKYANALTSDFEIFRPLSRLTDVVEIVEPSLVKVFSAHENLSGGSGFIFDESGYILTCAHVIQDKHNTVVRVHSGETFKAHVIMKDDEMDLALIKINSGKLKLKSLKFENPSSVKVGEFVLALGNCLSTTTATMGVVSGTERHGILTSYKNVKYIQTDAHIQPGFSGGPLVNLHGKVIGMSCMSCDGVGGLAISSEYCMKFIKKINVQGYLSIIKSKFSRDKISKIPNRNVTDPLGDPY